MSFLETGRSTPSREMVLRLADVLTIPLREQNALLEAASYARRQASSPPGDASALRSKWRSWSRRDRSENAYGILASAVFVVVVARLLGRASRHWYGGDFWEHSAVVRELAANPLAPGHPMFAIDAAHPFFSPWALAAAMLSRWSGIEPVATLTVIAVGHLVLLLLALPLFVRSFTEEKLAPFFALLFTLFLWGWQPWEYSSFLHFGQITASLPYPSSFALVLAMFGPVLALAFARTGRAQPLILLWLSTIVVLLSHPPTAAFLIIGTGAVVVGHREFESHRRRAAVGLAIAAAFVAAVFWPYYPFLELVLSDRSVFDASNQTMYRLVLQRTFPAILLGVPVLVGRLRRDHRDPLALLTLGLLAVYLFGAVADRWSLGRVLPFIVLALHVAVAGWVAQAASRVRREGWTKAERWAIVTAAPILLLLLLRPVALAAREVTPFGMWPEWARPPMVEFQRIQFVREYLAPGDVLAADMELSWYLPSLGAKIVAPLHPQAFVPDLVVRYRMLSRFFYGGAVCAERVDFLREYRPDLVLIDTHDPRQARLLSTAPWLGLRVYEDARFVLLRPPDDLERVAAQCEQVSNENDAVPEAGWLARGSTKSRSATAGAPWRAPAS